MKVAPSEDLIVRYALLAKVGHDFNNVLAVSHSVAEGLHTSPELAPSLRPEVDALMASVATATEWTQRLSRLRVTEGASQEVLAVDPVLHGIALELGAQGRAPRVQFEGAAARQAVRALAVTLERVVAEAYANARDAGATLLRLESAEDGSDIRVELTDDGEGMAPAILTQVFDPFFSTRGKKRGKGLGLCIVHACLATLAGRVEIESAVGKGTTLRMWVPRAPLGGP